MKAKALVVRRPDWIHPRTGQTMRSPHPFGARIIDGEHAGAVFCMVGDYSSIIGFEVTVKFVPEDQFATVVMP